MRHLDKGSGLFLSPNALSACVADAGGLVRGLQPRARRALTLSGAGFPSSTGSGDSLRAHAGSPDLAQPGMGLNSAPTTYLVGKAKARYKRFLETKNQALFLLLLFLIQVLYCRHVSLAIQDGQYAETKVEGNESARSWSVGCAPQPPTASTLPIACPFPAAQTSKTRHDPPGEPNVCLHQEAG